MSIYCISGMPGCGKSTFVSKLYKNNKINASIITEEIIKNNKRVGFKTIIKEKGKENIEYQIAELKNNNININYKYDILGKYIINLDNLKIISDCIYNLYNNNDILIIDEIANMQLLSYEYAFVILYILFTYKIMNKTIIFCCSVNINDKINKFIKIYIHDMIINKSKLDNTYYYLEYNRKIKNIEVFKKYDEILNNLNKLL